MEVGYEMEDDLYFADLSKRISLLIMDDDDDDQIPVGPWKYSPALQGFSRTLSNPSVPPPSMYEEHCRRSEITSKGTGVFIPKLSQPPRRRIRQGGRRRLTSSSRSHNNDIIHHTLYRAAAAADYRCPQKPFHTQENLKGSGL